MFPPSLHKNIRELDRQISLLETECETMDVDKKESFVRGKTTSKLIDKPFVIDSAPSACSHPSKKPPEPTLVTSKVYPTTCVPIKLLNKPGGESSRSIIIIQEPSKSILNVIQERSVDLIDFKVVDEREDRCIDSEETQKHENGDELAHDNVVNGTTKERSESNATERANTSWESETKNVGSKSSVSSINEVSSHDNWSVGGGKNRNSNQRHSDTRKRSKERVTQHLPGDKKKTQKSSKSSESNSESKVYSQKSFSTEQPGWYSENPEDEKEPPISRYVQAKKFILNTKKKILDEEMKSDVYWDEVHGEVYNGEWLREKERPISCPRHQIMSARRPRSIRTKKKYLGEMLVDEVLEKSLDEKEIQCMLWHEDNSEYLVNLNQSVEALYYLIGELRKKSSENKTHDVLNDMQNTLMKIGGVKVVNALYKSLNCCNWSKSEELGYAPDECNLNLQKTLFGVKKFCQQLSDEKSTLLEELAEKKRFIANMKNKEKEYLTLISSLKFNLEKTKEQADEGARAMTDLKVTQSKLQEETKVIEALKKSHEKMQEIVQNYVLENDKLRTQIKIAKLETHKYNALLAGKEVEIKKYKEDMELFQRQISEQLKLLRSKASGDDIDKAMEAITTQINIPNEMDDETFLSETTTFGKTDLSEPFPISSANTSQESLLTRQTHSNRQVTKNHLMANIFKDVKPKNPETGSVKLSGDYKNSIHNQITEGEMNGRDAGFKSCKSEESDDYDWKQLTNITNSDGKSESELEDILTDSNTFARDLDDMLKEARMKGLEKLCKSSDGPLITSSSDNTSGCSPNVESC